MLSYNVYTITPLSSLFYKIMFLSKTKICKEGTVLTQRTVVLSCSTSPQTYTVHQMVQDKTYMAEIE